MKNKKNEKPIFFYKQNIWIKYMDFNALVFSGGGVRGIAFGGVVEALDELDLLKQAKKIAGVSVGAIAAGLIAVGYSGKDVRNTLSKIDLSQFIDSSYFHTMDLYNLINYYGINSGDQMLEYYGKLLEDKTGNKNITFKQIYDEYGITLVIVTSCINKEKACYYSYKSKPDLPIRVAVRRSMSVPILFNPVHDKDDIYVDGGLMDNFPIWIFDNENLNNGTDSPQCISNSKTIGFKLFNEKVIDNYNLVSTDAKVDSLISYVSQLIESMMIQMERNHINNEYFKNTIIVDTLGISSFNFNLSDKKRESLIKSGYDMTKKHFTNIKEGWKINNSKNRRRRRRRYGK